MYHGRFKGTHYEAVFKWGKLLFDHGKTLESILFPMYSMRFENHCTCFAFSNESEIVFARNSDFLVSIEKLYMNCLYALDEAYAFNGNTTAYVEMEDGVNEHGLAAGLCFVYPKVNKPGFNAGMLIRYIIFSEPLNVTCVIWPSVPLPRSLRPRVHIFQ